MFNLEKENKILKELLRILKEKGINEIEVESEKIVVEDFIIGFRKNLYERLITFDVLDCTIDSNSKISMTDEEVRKIAEEIRNDDYAWQSYDKTLREKVDKKEKENQFFYDVIENWAKNDDTIRFDTFLIDNNMRKDCYELRYFLKENTEKEIVIEAPTMKELLKNSFLEPIMENYYLGEEKVLDKKIMEQLKNQYFRDEFIEFVKTNAWRMLPREKKETIKIKNDKKKGFDEIGRD